MGAWVVLTAAPGAGAGFWASENGGAEARDRVTVSAGGAMGGGLKNLGAGRDVLDPTARDQT